MTTPKISVLMPTFNYARFLPEAIESVLAQDFRDFELLIVDDHSTDDTAEAVKTYLSDPRVHFSVNSQNIGMVANWNRSLQLARGDYVKFLFADDKFACPNALGKWLHLLESHPGAVCAGSARYIIDEQSAVTELKNELAEAELWPGTDVMIRCLEENRNLLGEPSAVLFRKNKAARGFNGAYRQIVDLEMWFHLLQQGEFVYTPEPLVCFRKHPEQQTEVNKRNGVCDPEILAFLREWLIGTSLKEKGTPRMFFSQIRQLRKIARTHPEARKLELVLSECITPMDLFQCWLRHRITRPFRELKNLSRKLKYALANKR